MRTCSSSTLQAMHAFILARQGKEASPADASPAGCSFHCLQPRIWMHNWHLNLNLSKANGRPFDKTRIAWTLKTVCVPLYLKDAAKSAFSDLLDHLHGLALDLDDLWGGGKDARANEMWCKDHMKIMRGSKGHGAHAMYLSEHWMTGRSIARDTRP